MSTGTHQRQRAEHIMEQQASNELDPKTAKLIDEMEKSLHNMEKSLGPDHLVIAKILDSYAKLLRQHKLRAVDSVNMEARARVIRAKHNQKEAEKQSKGLGPIVQQEKKLATSQVKAGVWIVCLLVAVGLFMIGTRTLNSSVNLLKKAEEDKKPPELVSVYENKDPSTGEVVSKTTVTEPIQQNPKLTIFEIAGKLARIKTMAKQQLLVGQKQEKDGDLSAATSTYREVVEAEKEAGKSFGREAHSLEIAECFEHYAALIQKEDAEEAQNCLRFAEICRKRSN